MSSLEKRRGWRDLGAPSSASRRTKTAGEGFWPRASIDRTRENGLKLTEERVTLQIRKKFLALRVVKPRHSSCGYTITGSVEG